MEYEGHRQSLKSEIARLKSAVPNSKADLELILLTNVRREAQSGHDSTDAEKQKKINNLEENVVSLSITIEEKERMADKNKMDLNHMWTDFCSNFGIIKIPSTVLMELSNFKTLAASSVASGHTTSCQIDRTQLARGTSLGRCCDPEARPAASTAAASINTQSQEPSVLIVMQGDPMRLDRIPGEAILSSFRTLLETILHILSASTSDASMHKDME